MLILIAYPVVSGQGQGKGSAFLSTYYVQATRVDQLVHCLLLKGNGGNSNFQ